MKICKCYYPKSDIISYIYRQVAASRIFAWVSSCDERIDILSFLKDVLHHVKFQFLKLVSVASNINVYLSTRYVNTSLPFLFKCLLCQEQKNLLSLFHLPVSDLCKLPGVGIVSFNMNTATCRTRGQKVSVPTFLPRDGRFKYASFSVHLTFRGSVFFHLSTPSQLYAEYNDKTCLQNLPHEYCGGLELSCI